MWTNKKKILYLAYRATACWLPQSRHMPPAKWIRRWWGRLILEQMGDNTNIEHGAHFTPDVCLGDGSGIGVDCEIERTRHNRKECAHGSRGRCVYVKPSLQGL